MPLRTRSILMFRKPKFSNRKSFETSSISFHDSFSCSLIPSKHKLSLRDRSSRSRSLSFRFSFSSSVFSKCQIFCCFVFINCLFKFYDFSSIISCDASILMSFASLINFSLLMVISDDNLAIL